MQQDGHTWRRRKGGGGSRMEALEERDAQPCHAFHPKHLQRIVDCPSSLHRHVRPTPNCVPSHTVLHTFPHLYCVPSHKFVVRVTHPTQRAVALWLDVVGGTKHPRQIRAQGRSNLAVRPDVEPALLLGTFRQVHAVGIFSGEYSAADAVRVGRGGACVRGRGKPGGACQGW